ncbi:hypothetical protein CALVIDRAFT_541663 [Calocera viscosa TUFC12733]|uniref:Uncharacterized protein n=1 Tax=Calocera viscosa (strain TUFC12733) TaxID=1330018 RepID=A0A167HH96_CALVF|nr:hypothetical protein CALVIDRAFT_541663 [Calocera viscosa TUFC12733]
MREATIVFSFRSLKRSALVGPSFARCTKHPRCAPLPRHRAVTTQAVYKRLQDEKPLSPNALPAEYALPEDWVHRIKPPTPTYLFNFAVSRVNLVKTEVNDAAFILNMANNTRDATAIRTAYRMYASAARRMARFTLDETPTPLNSFQVCMRYIGPVMDILASSGTEEDQKVLETMADDMDTLWWPAIVYHLETAPEAGVSNWYTDVDRLIRCGRREKAIELLLRLQERQKRGFPQRRGVPVPPTDLRPSWRLVLKSYCDERDFQGIQTLLQTTMRPVERPIVLSIYIETVNWLCNLEPPPPPGELEKYAPLLLEPVLNPSVGQVSTLLRVCLRLGWLDHARQQVDSLLRKHALVRLSKDRFVLQGRLQGAAWDAMIEDAILRNDLKAAWRYVEQMAEDSQIPVLKNIKALVKLEQQHNKDLAELKRSLDPASAASDAALDGQASALEEDIDATSHRKNDALRRIFRALAEDEDPVAKALAVYDTAKAQGARPTSYLTMPIIDRLCSKEELARGGLQRSMELLKELDAAYPVGGGSLDPNTQSKKNGTREGPNREACTIILEALVAKPVLKDVTTVLSIMYPRRIYARTSLINSLLENSTLHARDHAEAFEFLRYMLHKFRGQVLQLEHYRTWINAIYPASNSIIPPADLVLTILPAMQELGVGNQSNHTAGRILTLLRRYQVLGRHIWATYGSSEQGKVLLTELHRSIVTVHQAVNNCRDPNSPLHHPSVWEPEKLTSIYALLMECYTELGQPEQSLQIFDMLYEHRTLDAAAILSAMMASRRLNDSKLAISIWTKARVAAANGEMRATGVTPKFSKMLWDSAVGSLTPANLILRSSADVVSENIRHGSIFAARRRWVSNDVDTATYLLQLTDDVGGDTARKVMEEDICSYLSVVSREMVRRKKMRFFTGDEEGRPVPTSLSTGELPGEALAPPPKDEKIFPMFKRLNKLSTTYWRNKAVEASWEESPQTPMPGLSDLSGLFGSGLPGGPRPKGENSGRKQDWQPKLSTGWQIEVQQSMPPVENQWGAPPAEADPLDTESARFETEGRKVEQPETYGYEPKEAEEEEEYDDDWPPAAEGEQVTYLEAEPKEFRPPRDRPPIKKQKSAKDIMSDLEVP